MAQWKQYSGTWPLQTQMQAAAAGTWPLRFDYILYSAGRGGFGSLGQNNVTNYSSPTQVGSLANWQTVSSGLASFSVKSDGTLWAWGNNQWGNLGLGDLVYRSSPVQVGALTNWSKVDAGVYYTTLAIKTDGTLWAWGYGAAGNMGNPNDLSARSSPVQVGTDTNWAYTANGVLGWHATKTNGTLWWCGGGQTSGVSGLNSSGAAAYRSSPTQVGALTNWLRPATYQYTACCTKTDGTLWSWGNNNYGELGHSNLIYRSSPVQVGALTNWSYCEITTGGAIALKTDGTLWAWGSSNSGNQGITPKVDRSSPTQIGTDTNWSSFSMGYELNVSAIKTNGTLWGWGNNVFGNLGDGTNVNKSSPVQIGASTTWNSVSHKRDSSLFVTKL